MSDKTGIIWTDATWNPVTGCSKVSQGCKHCYAEREWTRLTRLVPAYAGRSFSDVRCHPDRLDQPLRWKRPRKVFVNSMSDLFHPGVPDEFIDQVFAVMALAKQHTFQVLTKRPERMRDCLIRIGRSAKTLDAAARKLGYTFEFKGQYFVSWPLPNVHLGVTAENQEAADARIGDLLETPAAVRWVSIEPMIGAVSFRWARWVDYERMHRENGKANHLDGLRGIDWVVVGGESGPNARPMLPFAVRALRDQCAEAGVPFFFKQWGEWSPVAPDGEAGDGLMARVGRRLAGRLLDGVTHDGYPA